jgi:polyphosphate kinase
MISSADWMDRNFFRRIELAVPILDAKAAKRIMNEGLKPYLDDNMHAWEMQPDGTFKRLKRGRAKGVSAQQELLKALAG